MKSLNKLTKKEILSHKEIEDNILDSIINLTYEQIEDLINNYHFIWYNEYNNNKDLLRKDINLFLQSKK